MENAAGSPSIWLVYIAVFVVLCLYGKCCRYSIHLVSNPLRNKLGKHNSCLMLSCTLFLCRSIWSRLNGSCDIPALELDNSQSISNPDAAAASAVVSCPLAAVTHLPCLLWLLENCCDLCIVTYASLIGN